MFTTARLMEDTYSRILDTYESTDSMFVGIGGTSPWAIEGTPPSPSKIIYTQTELAGFIPIKKCTPVVKTADYTKATIEINSIYYMEVEPSISTLRSSFCSTILLEAELIHDALPVDTYRTIGVYKKVLLRDDVDTTKPWYLPEEFESSRLVYMIHQPPVAKTSGVVENIKILQEIP